MDGEQVLVELLITGPGRHHVADGVTLGGTFVVGYGGVVLGRQVYARQDEAVAVVADKYGKIIFSNYHSCQQGSSLPSMRTHILVCLHSKITFTLQISTLPYLK